MPYFLRVCQPNTVKISGKISAVALRDQRRYKKPNLNCIPDERCSRVSRVHINLHLTFRSLADRQGISSLLPSSRSLSLSLSLSLFLALLDKNKNCS